MITSASQQFPDDVVARVRPSDPAEVAAAADAARSAALEWQRQPLPLVADVPDGVRLRREEVFGPIATIAAVRSLEEAIDVVDSGRYGLVSGLHTTVVSDVWTFYQYVRSGMVKVNAPTTGPDYWAPFGGDKDSSFGPREQGSGAMQFYSTTQTTTVGPA